MTMSLGEALCRLRILRRLSTRDVARMAGMSHHRYVRIEGHLAEPTELELEAIMRVLTTVPNSLDKTIDNPAII